MNQHIRQLQEQLDANNKRLAFLPDGNDSDDNSVDPLESFKGRKANKKVSK